MREPSESGDLLDLVLEAGPFGQSPAGLVAAAGELITDWPR
jgi:hypothetical protein